MDGLIGPQDVGPAGVGVLQAGLGRVVQNFAQGLLGLHVPLHAQAPGQIPGLVKAPLAQALPAHRHPGDGVELAAELLRRAAGRQAAEAGQAAHAALEFEVQNGPADGVLVIQRRGHPAPGGLADGPVPGVGQLLFAAGADQLLIADVLIAEGAAPGEQEVQCPLFQLVQPFVEITHAHGLVLLA